MSHYLSFELLPGEPEKLEIHADKAGLLHLSDLLRSLATKIEKQEDHLHLMVPSWGGSSLSEETMASDGIQMKHVKVFGWREAQKKEA